MGNQCTNEKGGQYGNKKISLLKEDIQKQRYPDQAVAEVGNIVEKIISLHRVVPVDHQKGFVFAIKAHKHGEYKCNGNT